VGAAHAAQGPWGVDIAGEGGARRDTARRGAQRGKRDKSCGGIPDDAFGAAVGINIWLQRDCLVGKTGMLAKVPSAISGGAQLREDQSNGMTSRLVGQSCAKRRKRSERALS
jgi:hypothetical protein